MGGRGLGGPPVDPPLPGKLVLTRIVFCHSLLTGLYYRSPFCLFLPHNHASSGLHFNLFFDHVSVVSHQPIGSHS